MKIQTKIDSEVLEVNILIVIIGNTKFRISEEFGELIINKINFEDGNVSVRPQYTKQITIK